MQKVRENRGEREAGSGSFLVKAGMGRGSFYIYILCRVSLLIIHKWGCVVKNWGPGQERQKKKTKKQGFELKCPGDPSRRGPKKRQESRGFQGPRSEFQVRMARTARTVITGSQG